MLSFDSVVVCFSFFFSRLFSSCLSALRFIEGMHNDPIQLACVASQFFFSIFFLFRFRFIIFGIRSLCKLQLHLFKKKGSVIFFRGLKYLTLNTYIHLKCEERKQQSTAFCSEKEWTAFGLPSRLLHHRPYGRYTPIYTRTHTH